MPWRPACRPISASAAPAGRTPWSWSAAGTTRSPSRTAPSFPPPSPAASAIDAVRIALIHALRHSPPPIEAAFAAAWPEARLMNLLDDSLSADLARDGVLTPAMTDRFLALGRYAQGTGVHGVLFTCSA